LAVNLPGVGKLLAVPGVLLGVADAGIKARNTRRDDMVVIALPAGASVGGVFTRNAFRAAPVEIAAARVAAGGVRALVINSGNANAATGEPGRGDALAVCDAVASALGIPADAVAPFSTGVIGQRLPVDAMLAGAAAACGRLVADGWEAAARAIMTTDTQPKVVSHQIQIDGKPVTAAGREASRRPDRAIPHAGNRGVKLLHRANCGGRSRS